MFIARSCVQEPNIEFPKLMVNEDRHIISNSSVVLFESAGCGMCLKSSGSSRLAAGRYYTDLEMADFKDYERMIELRNDVSMNVQNVKTPLGMLLEECAELISAINRWQRGDTDSVSVMEEIADVEIMLEQMKITFDRETIESIKSLKLARLQKRIGEK